MSRTVLVADDSRTVRKVVERTLKGAGYQVRLAADGEEALRMCHAERPDLFLLDVVMPKVGGVTLAKALREDHGFAETPIILMTAREDGRLDALIEESGAVDAITKPFGPEALRAVTARVLERAHGSIRPYTASQPPPAPARTRDEIGDAAAHAADRVTRSLGPLVRRFTGTASPTDGQLTAALLRELSLDDLENLGEDLVTHANGLAERAAFRGTCETTPLVGILQLVEHHRLSGVLTITQGERRIAVCFHEGMVDIARGHGGEAEFLLGRYLLDQGLLDAETLNAYLAAGPSGAWLGARLVLAGLLTETQLRDALLRQTSELLYEVLRWRTGRFYFDQGARREEAAAARLGLPMAHILMEGLRRIDEWRLIEEQIRDFDMILERRQDAVATMHPGSLTDDEQRVLAAVDGHRSVRRLVEHTRMSSFDACKVLFRLLTSGLVHSAPVPRGSQAPSEKAS